MKLFIRVFVLFGCLAWWSALSGIASFGGPEVTYHPTIGSRIAMAASGTCILAFALACHLRANKSWECGFGLLAVLWIWGLFSNDVAVSEPAKGGLSQSALFAVGFSFVCLCWGVWWHRQKSYFYQHGD